MTHPAGFSPAALANHVAVLGKTGSGKTTTAKLLVEQVVEMGARVCVLDPIKSDWWGLTSSADGTRPGLPFRILGGPHGHLPLHPSSGAALGKLIGQGKLPLSILDMADFKAGGLQHFFIDFAEALLRHMRGVLYLVVEEAHEFAPKERSGVGAENMAVFWAKKLATAGRSKGVRLLVATQRTQALHNAVLGSCETMIVHRMTAPADQEPVVKWLKANTDKATAATVADSLSGLRTGAGWICSGEARLFEQVQFPRFKTFDNHATPTGDGQDMQVTTAPVDADELRAIIGDAVKEAEDNDPKVLRARIADLERQARSLSSTPPEKSDQAAIEAARREGEADGYGRGCVEGREAGYSAGMHELQRVLDEIDATRQRVSDLIEAASKRSGEVAGRAPAPTSKPLTHLLSTLGDPPAFRPRVAEALARAVASNANITGPQQRILDALGWWQSLGQTAPTRVQVAVVAGYSPKGGAFQNPLGQLRTAGLIDYPSGGIVALTPAGAAAANMPGGRPTQAELTERIMGILDGPQRRILEPLMKAYPHPLSRDDLAAAAGYQPTGGAFQNPLGALRSLGLIDYPARGQVAARPILFVGGRK